jgi:tripartite-type tricarboxylate transporter receptor subunit TctC
MKLNHSALSLGIAAACMSAGTANAQGVGDYPNKPVHVIVSQSTGGGTDIQARIFTAKLSETLKKNFVVDNKTGGNNQIGFTFVAKAAPDGYTLLATTPSFTFGPALETKLQYDPIKAFAPISLVTRAPYVLLVHPSLPIKTVKEWVAYAKANPTKFSAGVGGTGSFTHLAVEWLADMADVKVHHVPYKGTGPVLIDLMAGRVQTTFGNVLSTLPHIRSGKMRAVALSMGTRSPVLPDLPTVAESGFPEYDLNTWHGWSAPAGTPRPIINFMSAEVAKMVKSPEVADKLKDDGGEPVGSSPEVFGKLVVSEITRWQALVKKIGIIPE